MSSTLTRGRRRHGSMRLLNTSTLKLTFFMGQEKPSYAILSHTWDEEELRFEDLADMHQAVHKKGYLKVQNFCEQARKDGFEWVWIDTCCIDKSSSAELSEAINSMFAWYRDAAVCYAYLSDCLEWSTITTARWFTRGWTLQELIAPDNVSFFNANWELLRDRNSAAAEIADLTGIDREILDDQRRDPSWQLRYHFSVAQKFRWMSGRSTTCAEDISYGLLGIFDVNLPLLYGEGATKAFQRLQEAILKTCDDQTILAYTRRIDDSVAWYESPILATSPDCFQDDVRMLWLFPSNAVSRISYDGKALSLDVRLCRVIKSDFKLPPAFNLGILDATMGEDMTSAPVIGFVRHRGQTFQRPTWLDCEEWRALGLMRIDGDHPDVAMPLHTSPELEHRNLELQISLDDVVRTRITITDNFPSMMYPPLDVRSLDNADEHFTLDQSIPEAPSNGIIRSLRLSELGVMSFRKRNRRSSHARSPNPVSFLLIWGFLPEGQPWSIVPLGLEQRTDEYVSGVMRDVALGDITVLKELMSSTVMDDESDGSAIVSDGISSFRVTVRMALRKLVLDREMLEMDLTSKRLGDVSSTSILLRRQLPGPDIQSL